jgi:hypothetical protein
VRNALFKFSPSCISSVVLVVGRNMPFSDTSLLRLIILILQIRK